MIAKEIEKKGIPVAHITAISMLAERVGPNRIVVGTKVPHPCGDPNLPSEGDCALREEIVRCALKALETEVNGPTVFVPEVAFTTG